jgi:hypothetical protein
MARITRSIRSLTEDQVERGFDLGRPMHCDSCIQDKAPSGATVYGAYKLCNDCLLDFTVALASGTVEHVAEFMTRATDDDSNVPPSDLAGQRDRMIVTRPSLQPREKLLPSNEPC